MIKCTTCKSDKTNIRGYENTKKGRMVKVQCLNSKCKVNFFRIEDVRHSAKILHFDIETAPMEVYAFDKKTEYINPGMLKRDWFVICWSANWEDSDKVISGVLTPKEALDANDERITKMLWHLLDSADIIVTKNGKKFDEGKMNERFVCHHLPPPSKYAHVDTQEILKRFKFSWNGLDAVRKRMGGEGKTPTDFSWWVECMKGNPEYLKLMSEYCAKDVLENKILYHDIRAWSTNHPNLGLFSDQRVCPVCGSEDLVPQDKVWRAQVNYYPAYRCENCGHESRERKKSNQNVVQLVG